MAICYPEDRSEMILKPLGHRLGSHLIIYFKSIYDHYLVLIYCTNNGVGRMVHLTKLINYNFKIFNKIMPPKNTIVLFSILTNFPQTKNYCTIALPLQT